MGIYSKEGEKSFMEAGLLLNKASEDYYKSKMFYGNVQVYIDASNETEAKYFAARAINDFDTFCKCYTPNNGDKLNGIVVKPVGETMNQFIACTTDLNGNKKFEAVIIKEGKVESVKNHTVLKEVDEPKEDKEPEEKKEDVEEKKEEETKSESVNLARDF